AYRPGATPGDRSSRIAAELPIGVVTATLGAPVFIWLLLRSRGRG
ncbi:iron chelate uptake ABC transporter family permease subunit, partial [Klebsiella pneumoniae]